jgi:hypothetical protein
MQPFAQQFDLAEGLMLDPHEHIVRRASDMRGWAHRSINTGEEPLISLCLYPGDAGHNYGDIRTEGFPRRAFRRHGRIIIE